MKLDYCRISTIARELAIFSHVIEKTQIAMDYIPRANIKILKNEKLEKKKEYIIYI